MNSSLEIIKFEVNEIELRLKTSYFVHETQIPLFKQAGSPISDTTSLKMIFQDKSIHQWKCQEIDTLYFQGYTCYCPRVKTEYFPR